MVQSPTTPGQLNMWNNADIPRSDVPLQSNLVIQSTTTQGQFDMEECRHIQVRCTPPLIRASGTEHYYTRSV